MLAVKSVKTMPRKAIGEKKKENSEKNRRDICKETYFMGMAYLGFFFSIITQQAQKIYRMGG